MANDEGTLIEFPAGRGFHPSMFPPRLWFDVWHCPKCGNIVFQEPGVLPEDHGIPMGCGRCLGGLLRHHGQGILSEFRAVQQ